MKTISILAVIIVIAQWSTAQVQSSNPGDLVQPNMASQELKTVNSPKVKLIRETTLGKIYAMPQDNMPCLVPNMSLQNSMPVYPTPLANANMPNSILKQDYFGVPSTKNIFLKPVKITPEPSKNLMQDLIRKK